MANYNCVIRTNYFRVIDEERFLSFMARSFSDTERITVFEQAAAQDGVKQFAFGCYGSIVGVARNIMLPDGTFKSVDGGDASEDGYDFDEDSLDDFYKGLSELLPDDDAVIIMESGHEKLRYVTGTVTVLTNKTERTLDIATEGLRIAREMLENPNWDSETCY